MQRKQPSYTIFSIKIPINAPEVVKITSFLIAVGLCSLTVKVLILISRRAHVSPISPVLPSCRCISDMWPSPGNTVDTPLSPPHSPLTSLLIGRNTSKAAFAFRAAFGRRIRATDFEWLEFGRCTVKTDRVCSWLDRRDVSLSRWLVSRHIPGEVPSNYSNNDSYRLAKSRRCDFSK